MTTRAQMQAMREAFKAHVEVLHADSGSEADEVFIAIAEAYERAAWQSMDSAPKDGTHIDLHYTNSAGKTRTVHAVYVQKFKEEDDSDQAEYDEETDCYYTPEGWYEYVDNCDEFCFCKVLSSNTLILWRLRSTPPQEASNEHHG